MDIRISKTKTRRGTNDQRKTVVFDQGELVSTLDTKRLYIGTGTLAGGYVVGSKIHPLMTNLYSLSTLVSEVGDIVNVNNIFYQLTATNYANIDSWANVGTKLEPIVFSYDSTNRLSLNTNSISAKYINPTTVSNGLKISAGILQTDYNTKSLEISSNQISIKAGGIDEREINASTFGNGILGGSGTPISLNVDPSTFYFSSETLKLSGLPSIWFGGGLSYTPSTPLLSAILANVDYVSLNRNNAGVISINNDATVGTPEWAKLSIDEFGRVVDHSSSIFDTLTGNSSLSGFNSNNSLSALFNGAFINIPGVQITKFTALSSDGSTITLSSAGFITFEGNTTTRTGQPVGRFAIPIFKY